MPSSDFYSALGDPAKMDDRYARAAAGGIPKSSAVLLGDSFMDFNGGPRATLASWDAKGIWVWCNYFLGQRIRVIRNSGVGGQQMKDYLARVPTDVDAYNPGWVIGVGGLNDITANRTAAQMIADFTSLFNYLINTKGYRVSWNTITPVTTWTAAQTSVMTEVNMWLLATARNLWPSLVICDTCAAVYDPNGGIAAAWREDTTHLNAAGATRYGKAMANALAPYMPASSPLDSGNGASLTTNICSNGRFINPTAGVGSGWSLSTGAAVASQVARTDMVGNWQRLVVPTGDFATLSRQDTIGTKLTPGTDKIRLAVELNTAGLDTAPAAKTQRVTVRMQLFDAASTLVGDFHAAYADGTYANHLYQLGQGVFATPEVPVPATATKVTIFLTVQGGGTYDWDRVSLMKVV